MSEGNFLWKQNREKLRKKTSNQVENRLKYERKEKVDIKGIDRRG